MNDQIVNEEKNSGIPRDELRPASELSAARKAFRKSVGFQIMFILYSGMEVGTAIDHICSAADRLLRRLTMNCPKCYGPVEFISGDFPTGVRQDGYEEHAYEEGFYCERCNRVFDENDMEGE